MPNDQVKKFLCSHDASLREALTKIEQNTRGLLVIEKNNVVVGIITDGDIRRLLIDEQFDGKETVLEICNTNFVFAFESDPEEKVISLFSNKIKFLPILNQSLQLTDVQFHDQVHRNRHPKMVYARAPARITLGGGGSDKIEYFKHERGLCINAAIKKYAFCSLSSHRQLKHVSIISSDYDTSWEFKNVSDLMKATDPKLLIYQKVLSFLDFYEPIKIITHCDFPVGSGLGGSSALTVAMLHAFSELEGTTTSKIRLAKNAYKLERIAMRISGGWQDQYAASVGGVNAIFFSQEKHDVHNIKLSSKVVNDLEASLYLCFTGIAHDSSEIHKDIEINATARTMKMGETVRLAHEMLSALTNEDLSMFDTNINENWKLKKQYSSKITSELLDQKITVLKKAGASSAKIVGAGGGGYILARVPVQYNRVFVSVCAENGLHPERVLFDMEGVASW